MTSCELSSDSDFGHVAYPRGSVEFLYQILWLFLCKYLHHFTKFCMAVVAVLLGGGVVVGSWDRPRMTIYGMALICKNVILIGFVVFKF